MGTTPSFSTKSFETYVVSLVYTEDVVIIRNMIKMDFIHMLQLTIETHTSINTTICLKTIDNLTYNICEIFWLILLGPNSFQQITSLHAGWCVGLHSMISLRSRLTRQCSSVQVAEGEVPVLSEKKWKTVWKKLRQTILKVVFSINIIIIIYNQLM